MLLDVTDEELFFQFGMDNWSAYVDQVRPASLACHLPYLHFELNAAGSSSAVL